MFLIGAVLVAVGNIRSMIMVSSSERPSEATKLLLVEPTLSTISDENKRNRIPAQRNFHSL
jgi:hypothetical protein